MKISPVGAELFRANAPKNVQSTTPFKLTSYVCEEQIQD